ncbi:MAG: alpha/beta hydrolase [Actinobacteria bacterium]|nr:alpha/beta hydrolase [Actinomycetota bacterium]
MDEGVTDNEAHREDATGEPLRPNDAAEPEHATEHAPRPKRHDGTRPPGQHGRAYPLWVGLSLLLALAAVAGLAGLVIVQSTPQPLPIAPAGSFYQAPTPLPAGPPGTILRTEPITSGVPAGAIGYRILYLSETWDTNQPVALSGSIFVPTGGSAPAGGRPVVAWAHPTTGIASPCAPSLAGDGGASTIPGLPSFIDNGYVVVMAYYQGLGTKGPHPYLVGTSEAKAVLDSVRAAVLFPSADASRSFVVWGHSQGGQAALFTGQLAPTYAPELTLKGVAAAAPATDLGALLEHDLSTTVGDILGAYALVSWSLVYPDTSMNELAAEPQIKEAQNIATHCINNTGGQLASLPEAELLKLRFMENNPATTPPWQQELAANTPGASKINAPILITQGTADEVVIPSITDTFVQQQCANGEQIEYQMLEGTDHTYAGVVSAPAVVIWTQDRFAGAPAPNNCSSQSPSPA